MVWKLRDLRRGRQPADVSLPGPAAQPTVAAGGAAPGPRAEAADGGAILLEASGVSKSFGGLRAVRDVSLQVRRGEILGIIGPNGAGKTTLFNVLNGFLRPDAGSLRFEGRDVTGARPYDLCAAGVGRTFQIVRPFRRMTVLDNVMVGAFVRSASDAAAREAALEALAAVGLSADAGRLADGLTNRQQRLLELARALAGCPKLLLLDETLAGLGSVEVEELIDVVRRLSARGITIVIIEHTMQAMVRLVDRFVVLDDGAVLAQGQPAAITQHPAVIDAYLGRKWRAANA